MNLIMPSHATSFSPVTPTVNNYLISDHDDPNRDSDQDKWAESGNGTN